MCATLARRFTIGFKPCSFYVTVLVTWFPEHHQYSKVQLQLKDHATETDEHQAVTEGHRY